VIKMCTRESDLFHAQYQAVSKEYHYHILNRPLPCAIGADYVWHIRTPLDLDRMNQCCTHLVGTHDFKSFENTGSPRTSTIREIFFARVAPRKGDRLVFKISASGFLKNMVRNIMGTLVDAGCHRLGPDEFKAILAARDRKKAGATAPAKGLVLKEVCYE
jgi:tRNA pseudouridine38-40 synthase